MPPKKAKKAKKLSPLQMLIARLEKQRSKISEARDALRHLQGDIEDLAESTERGLEALDDAISCLSELA